MKPYKLVAAFSVLLLHSTLLVSCIANPKRLPKAPVKVHTVWSDDRGDAPHLAAFGTGLACKKSYRGIGIRTLWVSGEIKEVALDGPAWKAGVRIGDKILTEESFNDKPVGSKVTVRFLRGEVEYTKEIIIADVCFAE